MLQINIETKKMALELGRKHNASAIYVNNKGEFFTNESFCKNSVNGDTDKYAKVEVTAEVVRATNDLGKAEDVIAAIAAAETKEAIDRILEAEIADKNRTTVVAAATAKIATLKPAE